ncbi:MAG: hypothetical protein JSW46_00585 [Gemmatimonadota bacterium]|nr:MAG: hypothetical protein JSW46_00585 [Gemmatimonadota bacterium]
MSYSTKSKLAPHRALPAAGLLALATLAGCAKPPPTLLDRVDQPRMTREELRARNYDFVVRVAGYVETVAWAITQESDDIETGRAALYWAASLVPAVQSAAFRSDPAAGLIDAWALCVQQRDFFEDGLGKDVFGERQHIAVAASHDMLEAVENIAKDIGSPDYFANMKERVETWAADHPIETILLTRESTAPLTAAALGPTGGGTFAAVGNMADEVRDLSARISVYSELLPKQVRWQAALLLSAESGGVGVMQTLMDVQSLTGDLKRVTALLDSVPQMITAQRTAVMSGITAERIAVMRELANMLEATLETAHRERQALMDDFSQERIEALQELDIIAGRLTEMALEQAEMRIENTIDHFYWRAVQLLAVLAVLLAVAGFFVLRFLGGRMGTG